MNGFKQKKGEKPKFKMSLTNHARMRLMERFGLTGLGRLTSDDIEKIAVIDGAKIVYRVKNRNIIFIRNHRSQHVITFLTNEMWEQNENILV